MGLDMWAHRRLYVKQWEHQKPKDRYKVQVEKGGRQVAGIQESQISTVEEQVMYWRKANHIHAWFVRNVQKGVDDCGSYHVTWEQMGKLHMLCERVIAAAKLVDGAVYAGTVYDAKHPKGIVQRTSGKVVEDAAVAHKLLPTTSGFFFGSVEYDQYYLQDVKDTCNWVARMIKEHVNELVPGDIYYSSSW